MWRWITQGWELNWSSLYWSSHLLLVLSLLAVGLYVVLMSLLTFIALACERNAPTSELARLLNRRHFAPRLRRQVRRWIPLVTMLLVGYVLGAAGIFSPVHELHQVEVLSKDGDRVYTLNIPAFNYPGTGHDQVMTVRLCADGDDLPLRAGMVMEPFQYIQRKDCSLINASTSVDWLRDSRHNVVDKHGNILFVEDK